MSKGVGVLRRMFLNFKNSLFYVKQKDTLVGTDHLGNRYFERQGDKAHNLRASRYIEERKGLDRFDAPQIPVEWNAWLRGRRKDPPSLEELEKNQLNMMKTKLRAAQLEEKFSGKEAEKLLDQQSSQIAEDVKPTPKNTPFPVYEDFEISPGQKYNKKPEQ